MIRWLLVVLTLLCASPAHAAITAPDSCSSEEDNSDAVATCALSGVLAGDKILCYGYSATNVSATVTCTDSASNSYSAATYRTIGGAGRVGYSCATAAGSSDPTITMTLGSADYKFVIAIILRGANSCTPATADTVVANTGTSVATNSISTPAGAVIGILAFANGDTTITATNGSTQLEESEVNDAAGVWAASFEATSGGSQTTTWTLGTSRDWEATADHFIDAVATGSKNLLLLGVGE